MAFSVRARTALIFLFDLCAVLVAWLGAFLLRFNLQWQSGYDAIIWGGLGPLLLLQAVLVWNLGLHRSMWRFVGLHELVRVGGAVVFTGFLLGVVALALPHPFAIPRSIVLLYPLLLLFFMGGGRVAWRLWREYRLYHSPAARRGLQQRSLPVVVVGAGAAGAWLLRDLTRQKRWRVVGLVDDDASKHGLKVSGVRVHGPLSSLPSLMTTFRAKHVVVAIPTAQREVLRRVSSLLDEADFQLLTIPGISELMSGRVSIDALRPVAIEDLLGRDAVSIDSDEIGQMIANQRVLVTGAGGSIGSELCRQVAVFKPAKLILFDHSEYALYAIAQWFADHSPTVKVVALTGDVKDEVRVDEVFASYKPSLVLHAAAYKHVPLMEQNNAWQAVRNNVFGTLNVARTAKRYGSQRFVLVSTDKAVNPANVMGATKRLAEMLCEGLNNSSATRFMIVRFGNVLGSAGSVIPRFRQQIESGGPVTVTHPEITRYFMLTTEAAQLVLQAATMGDGGEVFVLDMGEPVRIVDLARKMIQLSGVSEDQIPLRFSGLRPGEKLYEELLADAEQTLPTPHSKLRIAQSRPVAEATVHEVSQWVVAQTSLSDEDVRKSLLKWIPEYQPATHKAAATNTKTKVASKTQKPQTWLNIASES